MSTLMAVLLRRLEFEPDGSVLLEYCIPTLDARQNGVLLNHTLYVPAATDYDDEIDVVREATLALLTDVLEDLPNLEPLRPLARDEEDDEEDDEDDDEDDDA